MKLDPGASYSLEQPAICSHESRQVNHADTQYFSPHLRDRLHRQRFCAGFKAACHHPDAGNVVFPVTVDSYGKPLFQQVFA